MRTPLQKGEKVLLVTYSSWTSLIVPVLIAIAGLVAAWFLRSYPWTWTIAVAGILYFLLRYFTWKANVWVVTSSRVIDESGLLSHFAKESPLEKINNVSYDQTLMGRLFNYGHVEIQTAAEIGATDYYNVNHPRLLKDTITAAQSDHRNWQYSSQAMQMAAALDGSRRSGASGPGSQGNALSPGTAAELEKLFDLKQKGALSEEEYNKAKSRLLG
ncbi:MAG: PH domain-containing protein [Puia sp.]|nr:PH domain-containing protein [Puia sp.]